MHANANAKKIAVFVSVVLLSSSMISQSGDALTSDEVSDILLSLPARINYISNSFISNLDDLLSNLPLKFRELPFYLLICPLKISEICCNIIFIKVPTATPGILKNLINLFSLDSRTLIRELQKLAQTSSILFTQLPLAIMESGLNLNLCLYKIIEHIPRVCIEFPIQFLIGIFLIPAHCINCRFKFNCLDCVDSILYCTISMIRISPSLVNLNILNFLCIGVYWFIGVITGMLNPQSLRYFLPNFFLLLCAVCCSCAITPMLCCSLISSICSAVDGCIDWMAHSPMNLLYCLKDCAYLCICGTFEFCGDVLAIPFKLCAIIFDIPWKLLANIPRRFVELAIS